MNKTCNTCYYSRGKKCSIMHSPISGCWADEAEARKRAQEIRNYASLGITIQPSNRVYKKPVSEKLDEGFMKLYEDGMNDRQISRILEVSASSVGTYRKNLSLPAHKKTVLREQSGKVKN